MFNSESMRVHDDQPEKRKRGQGKGSNFFLLGHDVWDRLLTAKTDNRLNLIIAYLVLLAGTGSNQRLTKWSAKACEDHTGLGKPRAKHAIEELIAANLVKRTDSSTRLMPQYELPELPADAEPIFLPVALVTGLGNETPILRRVRETGDPMLLIMLIDLYALVDTDATHGVPIKNLREGAADTTTSSRKIADVGAHAVWALTRGSSRQAQGPWCSRHHVKVKDNTAAWRDFWNRLDLLKQIGAIWYEPWVFDGQGLDAEPLMPVDPTGFYAVANADDEAKLTRLAFDASRALITEERAYLFDRNAADFFLPLTLHRQPPALWSIARLRVEADSPGRRLAWKRRRVLVEQHLQGFGQLLVDAEASRFNQPMRVGSMARTN